MVGGVFQGANTLDWSDAVNLFTITEAPPYSTMTAATIALSGPYTLLRYLSPASSYGNIAELDFVGCAYGPPASSSSSSSSPSSSSSSSPSSSSSSTSPSSSSSVPGVCQVKTTAQANLCFSFGEGATAGGSGNCYAVPALDLPLVSDGSGGYITQVTSANATDNNTGAAVIIQVHVVESAGSWMAYFESRDTGQLETYGVGPVTSGGPDGSYYYGTAIVTNCDPSSSSSSSSSSPSNSSSSSSTDSSPDEVATRAKVSRRYADGVHVVVPEVVEEVRQQYAHVVSQPWCAGLGLAGSALFKDVEQHDLDVVVFVKDWGSWLAVKGAISFPREIGGKHVDTWVHRVPLITPHMILVLDGMWLYPGAGPRLLSVDERIRTPQRPSHPSSDWSVRGPEMWAELHTKLQPDRPWLDAFLARIPCGDCKVHAYEWVAANAPEFGVAWESWVTAFHNSVNARLGKDTFTVAEAHARWFGSRRPAA